MVFDFNKFSLVEKQDHMCVCVCVVYLSVCIIYIIIMSVYTINEKVTNEV